MVAMIQIEDGLEMVAAMPSAALYDLETIAWQVLEHLNASGILSIVIASDQFVHELNVRYRGVDAPTDVLSFPAGPLPVEIVAQQSLYLGDLILAYHHTIAQANTAQHEPADEFALLVIHGILHLVGYDHDTPQTQQRMWQKQAELLNLLHINITVPDFIHSPDEL